MGGGLMQLVAYGAQDIYLTGNPQITFFKVVYRRHTNFSMESIQQTINGQSTNITNGSNASGNVTISRNGDLVYKIYVNGVMNDSGHSGTKSGVNLIKQVELEIGGQLIDKQTSEWMKIWNELTIPASKVDGFNLMTKGNLNNHGGNWGGVHSIARECQVPLYFWFCRNPGLALPLIALQYHEVKLKFIWDNQETFPVDVSVWADYIYLDTDERRRFAQISHEYLIEQLQIQEVGRQTDNLKLNMNHPVKELLWTETLDSLGGSTSDGTTKCRLQLNGQDRFSERYLDYFRYRQRYEHHTSAATLRTTSAHKNTRLGTYKLKLSSNKSAVRFPKTSTNGTELPHISDGKMISGSESTAGDNTAFYFNPTENDVATSVGHHLESIGIGYITQPAGGDPRIWRSGLTRADAADPTFKIALQYQNDDVNLQQTTANTWEYLYSNATVAALEGQATASDPIHIDLFKVKYIKDLLDTYDRANDYANILKDNNHTRIRFVLYEFKPPDQGQYNYKSKTHQYSSPFISDFQLRPEISVTKISSSDHKFNTKTTDEDIALSMYSFALKPEEHQPSGTCNFSRIDNAQLLFSGEQPSIKNVYAINYNVLRIMSGMGGLAYSN